MLRKLHLKYRLQRSWLMLKGVGVLFVPIFLLTGMVVSSARFWWWAIG